MKNNLNLILVILLFVIIGCSCPKESPQTTQTAENSTKPVEVTKTSNAAPSKSVEPKPETKTEAATGVNMTNFSKLRNGMSYQEAVKILGKEGEVLSESEIGGIKTVMYKWDADEGSWGANMNAMFQNGKLMSKSQFGLK